MSRRKKRNLNEVVGSQEPGAGEEAEMVAGSSEPGAGEEGEAGSGEPVDGQEDDAKRPGRPAGRGNNEYQVVTSHPTRCPNPKCGCTDFVSVPNARLAEVRFCGVMPNGQRYTKTTRIRRKCKRCGQNLILVERHYDPDEWR